MRKKLIKSVIFATVIVMLICILPSCKALKKNEPKSGMLFWEVNDGKGGKLYLLGSIHTADDSIYPLNKIVTDAFNESNALAVEADISAIEEDLQLQIQIMQEYMYKDGSTISEHVDGELLRKATDYLSENKMYDQTFEHFKPVFWVSLIEELASEDIGLSAEYGVDAFFINEAKSADKELLEIESAMDQIRAFTGLSDELQTYYFEDTVKNIGAGNKETTELYEVWKKGDEKKLEAFLYRESTEDLTEDQKVLMAEFNKIMIDDRNAGMAEKAEEYIKSGKTVFFVVGAAHMLGETGLVQQLKAKGYDVNKR